MLFDAIGRAFAAYLTQPVTTPTVNTCSLDELAETLQPGDVVLVEGNTRMSGIIKYLTQSTWTHATLYVGARAEIAMHDGAICDVVEADVVDGVRAIPLAQIARLHTRICRPLGLSPLDRDKVIRHVIGRLGHRYDLKNIFDLGRYLVPLPVPRNWRRRAMAFGSGDPTRAICSTMIAEAFQSVRYPILPKITRERYGDPSCNSCVRELYEVRHHSLFAPRDFDISPYFAVVKPTLQRAFHYRDITWTDTAPRLPAFVDDDSETETARAA